MMDEKISQLDAITTPANDDSFAGVQGANNYRWSTSQILRSPVDTQNIKHYGAVGNGIVDDTAAIQAAIDAAFALADGGIYDGSGVFIPPGKYLVSSTLNYKAPMYGAGTRLSIIESSINDGSAVIEIDNINHWRLSDFQVDGLLNNCIGIHAINTSSWYQINDVRAYQCTTGFDIEGWGGEVQNAQGLYCSGTGLIFRLANGARLNFVAETNMGIGFIIEDSQGVLLDNFISEGNTGGGGTIDDCTAVTLNAAYFESNPAFNLKVGYTTLVRDLVIIGGTYTSPYAANEGGILLDKVTSATIQLPFISDQSFRPFYCTSNAKYIRYNGQFTIWGNIQDDSKSMAPVYNYMPNSTFFHWLGGFEEIYKHGTPVISQETANVRTDGSALKVQTVVGNHSYVMLGLPDAILDHMKGNSYVFGAWIYIPNIAEFTDPEFPYLELRSDGTGPVIGLYTYNQVKKDCWIFVYSTTAAVVPADATYVRLFISPTRTTVDGDVTGNEYIIVDSIIIADAGAKLGDLISSHWEYHSLVPKNEGNNIIMFDGAAPTSTVMTFKVGDRVYHTIPVAGGKLGWVCTTAGSPGTWKTFGDITA